MENEVDNMLADEGPDMDPSEKEGGAAEMLSKHSKSLEDVRQGEADKMQEEMPTGVFIEGQLEKKEKEMYDGFVENFRTSPDFEKGMAGTVLPPDACVAIPLLMVDAGLIYAQPTPYGIVETVTLMVCKAPMIFEGVSFVRTDVIPLVNNVRKTIGYTSIPEHKSGKKRAYHTVWKGTVAYNALSSHIVEEKDRQAVRNIDGKIAPLVLYAPSVVSAVRDHLKTTDKPLMVTGLQKLIRESSTSPDLLLKAFESDDEHTDTDSREPERSDSSESPGEDPPLIHVP